MYQLFAYYLIPIYPTNILLDFHISFEFILQMFYINAPQKLTYAEYQLYHFLGWLKETEIIVNQINNKP